MNLKRWALVTFAFAACESSDQDIAYDLAAHAFEARVLGELEQLDFGVPEARSYLFDGWSRDEAAADGTTFVWSAGAMSVVRLFFAERRDVQLRFRCWPFPYPSAPPQSVTLAANGLEVVTLKLRDGPAEYDVVVPAGALEPGPNRLSFRYAWNRPPREVVPGSADGRSLAVGWDWLRIENAFLEEPPRVENTALTLPPHVRIEYAIELTPGSSLLVDGVSGSGSALRVLLDTPDGRRSESIGIGADVEFPLDGSGPALLSLEASGGPLRLTEPRIIHGRERVAARVPARSASSFGRPNILLYVSDTLRADRLGTYGYGESPSPRLDALASESTVFAKAYAQSSWTKSSMASVLTGLVPPRHGANERGAVLSSELSTLPERVQALGYDTAALVTNPNLMNVFGFAQGFASYEFLAEDDRERAYVRSDVLTERALDWLGARDDERPFFLYLHAMDPHDPYLVDGANDVGSMAFMNALEEGRISPTDDLASRLGELYVAEIRFNDEQFGRLLDGLRKLGLYEETLIVFLSDHGEEFAEHGWWRHGKTLYQEQLLVPMVVKWPGESDARRIESLAQHVDLVPTLLDYLGQQPDTSLSGRSLLPAVEGTGSEVPTPVTSYLNLDGRHVESVVLEDAKLIRYLAYDRPMPPTQFFRLSTDPGEGAAVGRDQAAVREFLERFLDHRRATAIAPEPETADIDPELRERLRALGYMK